MFTDIPQCLLFNLLKFQLYIIICVHVKMPKKRTKNTHVITCINIIREITRRNFGHYTCNYTCRKIMCRYMCDANLAIKFFFFACFRILLSIFRILPELTGNLKNYCAALSAIENYCAAIRFLYEITTCNHMCILHVIHTYIFLLGLCLVNTYSERQMWVILHVLQNPRSLVFK